MPKASQRHSMDLRVVRFVRATPPVPVAMHLPLPGGGHRLITGQLLGETHFDGELHHYRVIAGNMVYAAPPDWIDLTCFHAIAEAGMTLPKQVDGSSYVAASEDLTRRWIERLVAALTPEPEGVA